MANLYNKVNKMLTWVYFFWDLLNHFQPNALQEATVDPVHDDIEITNEGEGTDAFAVSITCIYGEKYRLCEDVHIAGVNFRK